MGSDFLSTSLFTHPDHITLIEAEFGLPLLAKLLPAIVTLFGAGLSLYLYHVASQFTIQLTSMDLGRTVYKFFNGKYYFDVIYNHYIINGSLRLGYTLSKVLDRGIIELVGPYGFSTGLTSSSRDIAKLDTGSLTSYALYFMLGLILLTFLLFSSTLLVGNDGLDSRLLLVYIVLLLLFIPNNNSTTSPTRDSCTRWHPSEQRWRL